MHHKKIPYIPLHQHPPRERFAWGTSGGRGSTSRISCVAQRWPPRAPLPGWLQDNAEAVSYLITQGNCIRLQGVLVSRASLLPAS